MAWKRLKLRNATCDQRATSSRSAKSDDVARKASRQKAHSNENDENNRRRELEREIHLALALARFREWDRKMQDLYGPLYYRAMRFSVH